MPRKQCACGCGEWFSGERKQRFKNRVHYVTSPQMAEQMRRASAAAQKPRRPTRLAGFGELTPREQAIYMRARENALTYSRAQQREFGRRKGWAEALGEHDAREVWQ